MKKPNERLRQARKAAGYDTPTDAAKALAHSHKLNQNTLISHENGNRDISKAAAVKYAAAFGVDPGWLLYGDPTEEPMGMPEAVDRFVMDLEVAQGGRRRAVGDLFSDLSDLRVTRLATSENSVPLKGYIGAGGEVDAVDGSDIGFIEAPAEARPDTVAAIVRGLSMLPAYEEGTVIYWSLLLPPESLINRRCVAQLSDGRIMIKQLRAGSEPGLWTLVSVNQAFPDIEDVSIEWVAKIDWTKPR